ncbi:MAG: hypothetical protein RIC16_12870 [Rhodospirillales bacterium]
MKSLFVIPWILAIIAIALPIAAVSQVPKRAEPAGTVLEERDSGPQHKGHQAPPSMDPAAKPAVYDPDGFRGDPVYPDEPYSPESETAIYGGKYAVDTPRPVLELGYPQYKEGPFGAGHDIVGRKNLVRPQLIAYGDLRTAVAINDNGAAEVGQVATRINLDVDLKLTATERIHAFFRPLDQGGKFTRTEFSGGDRNGSELIIDGNLETLFFEGDVGAIQSGLTDEYANYDLPFSFGLMPMFFQNGNWMDDAILGVAAAIPARNSPALDISNFDVTAFAGFDKVSTNALKDDDGALADHAGNVFGIATFMDTRGGYLEAGWGYVDDRRSTATDDFDYHNLTLAWTRRYGGWLSNSVRGFVSAGQSPAAGQVQTADGFAILMENSLITSLPSTLVPYANFFVGVDRPQPLARGGDGLLKNTGINFETDGLTGFPKLDDTAQDAWGGAVGVSYLFNLDQQLVVEAANVQPFGENSDTIVGRQTALGVRYQIPLTNQLILRTDAMVGFRENDDDLTGARMELRLKF